jgi:hypothetical protein
MSLGLYAADTAMLLLAVLAALVAFREAGRRIIPRWRLLLPGLLAALSTATLVAYPQLRDLFEAERWMVGTLAFLAGAVRGGFIGMSSDHVFGLVRLRRAIDSAAIAGAQVLFVAFQFAAEIRTAGESRIEPTIEALVTVTAGYLFGRSLAAWLRARSGVHYDLREE